MLIGGLRRGVWISMLWLAVACEGGGGGDGSGSGSETGADCGCESEAPVPVCGVDGTTHDAAFVLECVAVEIECMGECPCSASTDESGATSDGSGSGSTTAGADSTSDAETTVNLDPCDCMSDEYYPVCGVDGMTYDASCGLECVEVQVEILCEGVECPCPGIACGDVLCDRAAPVCTSTAPGPKGPIIHECGPIPATCDGVEPPTCECITPRGCDCTEDPAGYFQVSCALP